MQYKCVATSLTGFVQQLAVAYIAHGYRYYVTGVIPAHKDPAKTDRKLLSYYNISKSRWQRARLKRAGQAAMQYIRWEHFFVLVATEGKHWFFDDRDGEGDRVRDVRLTPIKVGGYSISYRQGHTRVRIEREKYRELKAYAVEFGLHHRREAVEAFLRGVPFEPYAPVKEQLFSILKAVNAARRTAGFELIPGSALRLHRRRVRPFEPTDRDDAEFLEVA